MIQPQTIFSLFEARRHFSPDAWRDLTSYIAVQEEHPTPQSITRIISQVTNQDAAWLLSQALNSAVDAGWSRIATAMSTIDLLIETLTTRMEFIWTGPANGRFPVRRIDQVIYDLVIESRNRIVLVTFAAYRMKHLCNHLATAVARGVNLTLILESEDTSEGQLSFDALNAFRELPMKAIRVLYWPTECRERNDTGRPGKLHSKCAIVDDVAVVGSANFTNDAFNRNMELGVLVREPSLVQKLALHFEELYRGGILRRIE